MLIVRCGDVGVDGIDDGVPKGDNVALYMLLLPIEADDQVIPGGSNKSRTFCATKEANIGNETV